MTNQKNNQETNTIIEILKEIKETLTQTPNLKTNNLKESMRLQLLTKDDVQDLLKISLSTANRFIRDKIFPTRKIGSRYYFFEEDIYNALEKCRIEDEQEGTLDEINTKN